MAAIETSARARLPGGPLKYTLRLSPRARRLRVTVDPRRGVVVTVPARRSAGRNLSGDVERFLAEREPWVRRHVSRQATVLAGAVSRDDLRPGSVLLFRGEPHAVRFAASPPAARRSTVSREGTAEGDELVIRVARSDRREPAAVLLAWLRERAGLAIGRAIERHASALAVDPAAVTLRDQRTRWGSATRTGRLSFSWRLVLAPPEALETVVVHELAHLRVFGHGPDFWALVASRRPDHREWRRWLRRHSVELHATLGSTGTNQPAVGTGEAAAAS